MAYPIDYDAKFLQLALNLQKATQRELDVYMRKVTRLIKLQTRFGKIADPTLLNKQIDKVTDEYFKKFALEIRNTAGGVGAVAADQALEVVIPLLVKAKLYQEAVQLYKDIGNYAADVEKRIFSNGWAGRTLGFRLKTIQEGTQRTIQNIIVNGVNEGRGARDIAKDLRQYINPIDTESKIAPLDQYRTRFGRPKNYKVPGIPRGSVQYNSYRIARTETAHIYRQSAMDFYENRDWVKGFRWVLSPNHPKGDICDEWSRETYERAEDVPTGHPNCLCRVRPIIMTATEMRELRFNYGDIGNPYRDEVGKFSNADLAAMVISKKK